MKPTKARLEIPPDTEANVIQETDAQGNTKTRATFKAHAIPDNNDESSGGGTDENLGGTDRVDFDNPTYEALPETQLDRLFADIRLAASQAHIGQGNFFAYVVRVPDFLGVTFMRPCNTEIDHGAFQFSLQDQLQFQKEVQKRNGNSGGVFNIRILAPNRNRLIVQDEHNYAVREVGLVNYYIPDPYVEPENGQQATAPDAALMAVIGEMRQDRALFIQMLQEQRNPAEREKSTLEKAIEEKVLHDIINPPAPTNDPMNNAMAQMFVMPEVAKRWAERMFPEPIAPPEPPTPDVFDKIEKFSNSNAGRMLLPAVTGLVEKFGETAQAFAVERMSLNNNNLDDEIVTGHQPHAVNAAPKTEMQELIETIIVEIESANELDESNAMIRELRENYPEQSEMLIATCQTLPFESTLAFMMNLARKMQPSPFAPFVDMDASQKAGGKIIWNARGERAKARLETFHAYLKTVQI